MNWAFQGNCCPIKRQIKSNIRKSKSLALLAVLAVLAWTEKIIRQKILIRKKCFI